MFYHVLFPTHKSYSTKLVRPVPPSSNPLGSCPGAGMVPVNLGGGRFYTHWCTEGGGSGVHWDKPERERGEGGHSSSPPLTLTKASPLEGTIDGSLPPQSGFSPYCGLGRSK
jgi:hypothetical protein